MHMVPSSPSTSWRSSAERALPRRSACPSENLVRLAGPKSGSASRTETPPIARTQEYLQRCTAAGFKQYNRCIFPSVFTTVLWRSNVIHHSTTFRILAVHPCILLYSYVYSWVTVQVAICRLVHVLGSWQLIYALLKSARCFCHDSCTQSIHLQACQSTSSRHIYISTSLVLHPSTRHQDQPIPIRHNHHHHHERVSSCFFGSSSA
jgi:hypothetical protein